MEDQGFIALAIIVSALVVHAIALACQRHADRERAANAPTFTQPQVEEIAAQIEERLARNGLDKLRVRRPLRVISPEEWTVPNLDIVRMEIASAIETHATAKRDHPEGYARAKREAEAREKAAQAVTES